MYDHHDDVTRVRGVRAHEALIRCNTCTIITMTSLEYVAYKAPSSMEKSCDKECFSRSTREQRCLPSARRDSVTDLFLPAFADWSLTERFLPVFVVVTWRSHVQYSPSTTTNNSYSNVAFSCTDLSQRPSSTPPPHQLRKPIPWFGFKHHCTL